MPAHHNIKVAILDDHPLFLKGFSSMVEMCGYPVILKCINGQDLISKLDAFTLPDVIFMDVNMPQMDGYETTLWLKEHHPSIKILTLSVDYNQDVISRMMENGANGFILKRAEPNDIKTAIQTVMKKGIYLQQIDVNMQNWLKGKAYYTR